MTFYVPVGCARLLRYCGKMYSRHFFPYGGLSPNQSFMSEGKACLRVYWTRNWFLMPQEDTSGDFRVFLQLISASKTQHKNKLADIFK